MYRYFDSVLANIGPAQQEKREITIMIKIVTDSTCDLPQSVIDELGITVLPMYINVGEVGYQDGVDITREAFYKNLPGYDIHPTTGTPGIDTFIKVFRRLATEGASQVLSIHISEKLSAVINVAHTAAQQFIEIPVKVIDSQQLSMGTGFQVEAAARMAKAGATLDEILAGIKDIMSRTYVTAALDTLEFLRRSGRMNAVVTGIGSLIKLKPILTMEHGEPGSERVRTTRRAITRLKTMLEEHQPIERFALLHTNARERAEAFRAKIEHLIPEGSVDVMDITPVIGSHIGPGAVGFAVITKEGSS